MHILEIPSFFPPHGGLFALEQARALQVTGNTVRMLACVQLGVSVDQAFYFKARSDRWWENMNGVEVYRSYMRALPRCIRPNQQHWCRIVLQMYDEYKLRYGRPDVLHAHCCQWAGVAARMIAEKEDIPFFITEHLPSGIFESNYGKGWKKADWARRLLQSTYEQAHQVIPVSAELVDDLQPFFGRNYSFTPISNIIDVNFFAFRPREPKQGRRFRFCCLAVADFYRKGFDVLAEAIKGMVNVELHIAGKGTDQKKMRQLFGNASNVIYHGELGKEGVRDLLYQSDALVLASRSESQGLVIMEAVSTGIPVVTTDAIPSNALTEGACLIAKSGDAESLRQRMEDVMRVDFSPQWSQTLRQRVSPEVIAQKILNVFSQASSTPLLEEHSQVLGKAVD